MTEKFNPFANPEKITELIKDSENQKKDEDKESSDKKFNPMLNPEQIPQSDEKIEDLEKRVG